MIKLGIIIIPLLLTISCAPPKITLWEFKKISGRTGDTPWLWGEINVTTHISGRIVDEVTNKPIKNVDVIIWGKTLAYSDKNGFFTVANVPLHKYDFVQTQTSTIPVNEVETQEVVKLKILFSQSRSSDMLLSSKYEDKSVEVETWYKIERLNNAYIIKTPPIELGEIKLAPKKKKSPIE